MHIDTASFLPLCALLVSLGALWTTVRQARSAEQTQNITARTAMVTDHAQRLHEIEVQHGALIASMEARLRDAEMRASMFQAHFESCERNVQLLRSSLEQWGKPPILPEAHR